MTAECPCSFSRNWNSQPMHGKIPVGNIIFSAGIPFSGSNPTNVLQRSQHVGVPFLSIRAYNYIQRAYLVTSVTNV